MEDALREKLMGEHERRPAFRLRMRMIRGYAPPRVDISDRDALYDVLDRG